jgi:hypothetical protein
MDATKGNGFGLHSYSTVMALQVLQNDIQSALLSNVSSITPNVYDYMVAVTKTFQKQILVTYELNNTVNTNTFNAKEVVKEFDVLVRLTTNTIKDYQSLETPILTAMYSLTNNINVPYVSLTNIEQPVYDSDKQMYSALYTFSVHWAN